MIVKKHVSAQIPPPQKAHYMAIFIADNILGYNNSKSVIRLTFQLFLSFFSLF